jgi:hypothetical protein
MIEGSAEALLGNIDHQILAKILESKVKDKNLIDLY